jgi:hypothetical protein
MIDAFFKIAKRYFQTHMAETVLMAVVIFMIFWAQKIQYINIFLNKGTFPTVIFVSFLLLYRPRIRFIIVILLGLVLASLIADLLPLQYVQEYLGIFIFFSLWYAFLSYLVSQVNHPDDTHE